LMLMKELLSRLEAASKNLEWEDIKQDLTALREVEIVMEGKDRYFLRTELLLMRQAPLTFAPPAAHEVFAGLLAEERERAPPIRPPRRGAGPHAGPQAKLLHATWVLSAAEVESAADAWASRRHVAAF
jgi:hypothetical protein